MIKYAPHISLALISLILAGCSSDDASTGTSFEIGSPVTATFVDAPVAGLNYSSASRSGKTSTTGTFSCVYGEVVTFSVGDLELGEAACTDVIFPMNLTGEDSVNPTGGAVAMGVLFKALDQDSSDTVFTIPTAVGAMNFSSSLNFSTFNSGTNVANLKTVLDEINSDAGLTIDSADIQTNYATTYGPAAVAELESSITNPEYVALPDNVSGYDGKYFLLTGLLVSGSDTVCGTAATYLYMGVGFASQNAGAGTAYRATFYDADENGFSTTDEIGKGMLTSRTLAVHTSQTVSSATVVSHAVIKFPSNTSVGLSGSAKVLTTVGASTRRCLYKITAVETTPTAPPTGSALLTISSGPTYDYGTVSVGSSNDFTFTVSNSGDVTATSLAGGGLAAPYSFKGGVYPGTGGTCGASLMSAASCTVVVTFAPASTGVQNDTLEISYSDGSSTQTASRTVTGTATAPVGILFISNGPAYDFGVVTNGSSVNFTFTVTNAGGGTATALNENGLAAPFSFSGGAYPGTGGTCAVSLAASATCTMVVTYAPTTLAVHTDQIMLNYNDGSSGQTATRDVMGTGN